VNVTSFFRSRGPSLAAVVLIMLAISIAQVGISYTMTFGALSGILPRDRTTMTTVLVLARFALVALMAVLWVAGRKRALFRMIVVVNALFTLALLVHTSALTTVLFHGVSEAVNALMVDVVLMATANILIFSVWYWIIDPPGEKEIRASTSRGRSSSPSAPAPFRTMNPGFLATGIISTSRSPRV
jgi:hypothetical protein